MGKFAKCLGYENGRAKLDFGGIQLYTLLVYSLTRLLLLVLFSRYSKPRGYGFCEYMNPEIALCAMRNLNGYEIGGRTLRVDSACTEKNQMDSHFSF